MGVTASAWAWRQSVRGNAKLVLLALADTANDDGTCWPGLRRLAEMSGVSERRVRGHISDLEDAGMLRREARFRKDGSQTSNVVVLNLAPPPDASDRGACLQRPGTEPSENHQQERTPPNPPRGEASNGRRILSPAEEPIGFAEWLDHHAERCGEWEVKRGVPRESTSARTALAHVFAALLEEGYGLEDFKLASEGVLADEFMRAGGHTAPENVLRKTKIAKRIDEGRAWRDAQENGKYARFG